MPTIEIRPSIVLDQSFGFTPENVANKSTDGTLTANSATLYPSQSAVKTYADAKVADVITNAVTTIAPSQNAVFDALALKQDTLTSGTTIKTINGVDILSSGNLHTHDYDVDILALQGLGSAIKAQTVGVRITEANTAFTLTDNQLNISAIYVQKAFTATGVIFYSRVAGVFTGDQENNIGLYSYNTSNGDLTQVALTANDANIWKGTANTFKNQAFSSTVVLTQGLYFVTALYNTSAPTTAPQIATGTALNNIAMASPIITNTYSAKLYGTRSTINTQSTLGSYNMSTVTASVNTPWFGLY